MIFPKIQAIFSPNGLQFDGGRVKLASTTKMSFSASGDKVKLSFEAPYPLVSFEKEIKIFGKVIATPSFSRNVTGIVLTSEKIVLELGNFPDFEFNYR
jgi:hypothetical protein